MDAAVLKKTFAVFVLLFFTAGCTTVQSEKTVSFSAMGIDSEGTVVFEKELTGIEGETLFSTLQKNEVQMEYDEFAFGVMLKSISGLEPMENEYLALYVNDEYANEGISSLKISEGNRFLFRAEKIETFPDGV